VDGNSVVAALNPGDYVTKIRSDISIDPKWASERLTPSGNGRQIGFRYFGTGDIGGAPTMNLLTGWKSQLPTNQER
jgi:alpha-mannosidase